MLEFVLVTTVNMPMEYFVTLSLSVIISFVFECILLYVYTDITVILYHYYSSRYRICYSIFLEKYTCLIEDFP